MPQRVRSLATAVFIALLTAASAFAQAPPPRSALGDYKRGESLVKEKKWDEAIAALNAAVSTDPKDRMYRDGVITDKYFPHHYLFIAYTEKGDLAKAREAFNARGPLPADYIQQEGPYIARLNGGPAGGGTAAPAGGGAPAGTPAVPAATPAAPAAAVDRSLAPYKTGVDAIRASRWQEAIAALNNAIRIDGEDKPKADVPDGYFPHYYLAIANLRLNRLDEAQSNFEKRGTIARNIYLSDEEAKFSKEVDFARLAPAGEDALGKQQWAAAVDNLNKACTALPDECSSRGLTQKLADARAGLARTNALNESKTHVANAQLRVAESDFDAAKREFRAALTSDANNADAAAGAKDIQTREDTYNAAKARGAEAQKANRLDDALREYEAARTAHGQWFRRDKLEAVLTSINDTRVKTQGIAALVADAQKAFDAGNFASAKQTAEGVLAKEPGNTAMKAIVTRSESRLLYDEGRKMAAGGDYFTADAKYKDAMQKDPGNDAAQKAYNQSKQYLNYVQDKLYTQAKTLDPTRFGKDRPDQDPQVLDLMQQANVAFDGDNLGAASKLVADALNLNPTNKNAIGLQHRIEAVRATAAAARAGAVPAPVQAPVSTQTTAPLLPMWVWATVAAVTFLGAGSLVMIRGRTPMPVGIDALPWGKVSIQQNGKPAKAAPSGKATPFSIDLSPGEYELLVTSETMSQPYAMKVRVERGQQNKFVVTMPTYDVDEIVATLLG